MAGGEIDLRKLASIQTISEKRPIENADAIEVVKVLGWYVVTKKGEFDIGDQCVYCEIDSVMPEKEEFEFLRKTHFRIRTCKLRGQISQGICFPLSILPDGDYEVNQDVTEILGVEKYEPPAVKEGGSVPVKAVFPSHLVPKTDETRVQVLQEELSKYKGTICYITEKVDGTSATYIWRQGEFMICSRNQMYENTGQSFYHEMAKKYQLEENLAKLERDLAIQGEIIGPGIQSNKYKLNDKVLKVFNIYDLEAQKYLDYPEFIQLSEELGLETVQVLDDNYVLTDEIEALVELSRGRSTLRDIHREGIVIRPLKELLDMSLGRVSFKSINPDFLLKYE